MANFNFNKVILGGRLTADPELKQTQSGISVTTFSVAVNRRLSKADGQEPVVDFFNCVAWRQNAEFISKFFRKGSSICVTGSLQNRTWTDQQGQKRYITEVVVDEASFVDSKSESAQHGTMPSAMSESMSVPSYASPAESTQKFAEMSNDDDLPF